MSTLRKNTKTIILALLLMILLASSILSTLADPIGFTITSTSTENASPQSAATMTTAGGTFTTLLLNATMQTPRWKAYVGNVSGRFSLRDALNFTLYDWNITTIAGEIYASRNSSPTWANIRCANNSTVITEQTQLNITTTKEDSINRTFHNYTHKGFYVGTTLIANSTCRAISTYVNNTKQTTGEAASFQEILLSDSTDRVIYATILENKVQSYNNNNFDFQMIVAESEYLLTPSTYYFWVELS